MLLKMYVELCFLFNITSRLKHEAAVRAVLKHEMKNGLSVRYIKKKKPPASLKFELHSSDLKKINCSMRIEVLSARQVNIAVGRL